MDQPRILMVVTSAARMPSGKDTGLWLEEFAVPYATFREAGAEVTVASPQGGATPIDPRSNPDEAQARQWQEASERLAHTLPLEDVRAEDFDAVFLPGGHGTMFDLPDNPALKALLEAFARADKVIAAVCHGPAGLVGVNGPDGRPLVADRQIAVFTDEEERAVELDQDVPFLLESRLRELGARVDPRPPFQEHAVRDGRLVTGQNPPSSARTAALTLEALRSSL
ncbi:type 1 glutamine amidotransferase domain-containing protein [Aquisalimonas lutea]|uniref:type 1 glutamine amidotransferase domain-containing protein n=1 Tax=Aquisalimonas lutea TaxID=1327750 RepID=UPI0025B37600|nr:type 1 glutamine amidotransferase domain-containing protein [Aquisalimonas lutea]MDN3516279.1 type 1 glutamine amidotransferase domain-containing protein [Aquisalimonas lutea]